MQSTTAEQVYEKVRLMSTMTFIVLLGGGFAMVLSAGLTQGGIFQVGVGFGLMLTSAIFVTLGLNAKTKLKKLREN